jgi:hypothetical protein
MWTVTQVSQTLQHLVTTTANQLARETGFVQRASKLTGAAFVQTLLFGWLNNPQATLQQLAQMAGSVGVAISPQGLDQRFTQTAAGFLQRLLEAAVTHVVTAHPVTIPLIERFTGVYLLDSSTIVLPDELSQVWRGCGGNQAQRTQAALKLQVQFDLSTGALRGPWLQDGRGADQAAPNQTAFPPGALRLADSLLLQPGRVARVEHCRRLLVVAASSAHPRLRPDGNLPGRAPLVEQAKGVYPRPPHPLGGPGPLERPASGGARSGSGGPTTTSAPAQASQAQRPNAEPAAPGAGGLDGAGDQRACRPPLAC